MWLLSQRMQLPMWLYRSRARMVGTMHVASHLRLLQLLVTAWMAYYHPPTCYRPMQYNGIHMCMQYMHKALEATATALQGLAIAALEVAVADRALPIEQQKQMQPPRLVPRHPHPAALHGQYIRMLLVGRVTGIGTI